MSAPATAPAARRRLAGRRAHDLGIAFEDWLRAYIFRPLIERQVILRADKLDPPARPTWDGARRRVVLRPVAAGGADWLLCAAGGRYVAVESKSTDAPRFYRSELTSEQIKHLDTATAAGGGAYLAVQFRDGPTATAFLAPWPAVPWGCARTALSVTAADLDPWRLSGWIDAARILGAKGAQAPAAWPGGAWGARAGPD